MEIEGGFVEPEEGGMGCSGVPNEHRGQDAFVLLPTGTIDRGTPKHDSVGTVLSGSIAHLIRCSPAGEAAFIPCPEEAGPSSPARETRARLASFVRPSGAPARRPRALFALLTFNPPSPPHGVVM